MKLNTETTELTNARVPILMVDDVEDNLLLLARTLGDTDYVLHQARDGQSAMELAQRFRPAVVLLDIMMPGGLDGYEVCRRLNQWPEDERPGVIFLSALDRTSSMVKGLQLGAVDYIAKPFQPREVRARVATQVTVYKLRHALVERNARLSHELRVAEEMLREARKRVAGPLLGESEAVRGLREAAARRAADDEPMLMLGPPRLRPGGLCPPGAPRLRQALAPLHPRGLPVPGRRPGQAAAGRGGGRQSRR